MSAKDAVMVYSAITLRISIVKGTIVAGGLLLSRNI